MKLQISNPKDVATETFYIANYENPLFARVYSYNEMVAIKFEKRPKMVQILAEFGMIGNFSKN